MAGVIVAAVIFAGSNGFHDAALTIGNAVVGRALSPKWALGLAVVFNFNVSSPVLGSVTPKHVRHSPEMIFFRNRSR